MGLKADNWIRKMALEHGMIEPFIENQVRKDVISYGVSSYGYDVRVTDEFKIFTNVHSAIVDPKNFVPESFIDFKGDVCIIPPNSFVLARTAEYFRIPRAWQPTPHRSHHRLGHSSAAIQEALPIFQRTLSHHLNEAG